MEFLGRLTDEEIRDEYRRARARCSCPARRTSASCPVEAQACGRPVVALARGGALETVIDGETGVLFDETDARSRWPPRSTRGARSRFDAARIRATPSSSRASATREQMRRVIDETMRAPAGTRW